MVIVRCEDFNTNGMMLPIWDGRYESQNIEVEVTKELFPSEKEWLSKVVQWAYPNKAGRITINGKWFSVAEFADG